MTSGGGALKAIECAEMIAPHVDRLRLAIAERAKAQGPDIAAAHGLELPAVMAAGYLRNVYPDRPFDPSGLLAVFTYQSPDMLQQGLDALLAAGHLAPVDDTRLGLTDTGREVLGDMAVRGDGVVQALWPDRATVERILPLAERAVAAIDDGGATVAVMAPSPDNPAHLSPPGWLGELLTGLRFHRFDSHIAAWRAAGLTVDQITSLGDGPERDAIEADTNRRSATPYAALTPEERSVLVDGLAALPS